MKPLLRPEECGSLNENEVQIAEGVIANIEIVLENQNGPQYAMTLDDTIPMRVIRYVMRSFEFVGWAIRPTYAFETVPSPNAVGELWRSERAMHGDPSRIVRLRFERPVSTHEDGSPLWSETATTMSDGDVVRIGYVPPTDFAAKPKFDLKMQTR